MKLAQHNIPIKKLEIISFMFSNETGYKFFVMLLVRGLVDVEFNFFFSEIFRIHIYFSGFIEQD